MKEQYGWIKTGALILGGTLLVSAAIQYIYLPASLDTGGVSGVAVLLNALLGLPLWLTNTVLNIPLFLAGLYFKGWRFIRRTLAATALMSLELYLLPEIDSLPHGDLFLAAVFGGLLSGVGLGMVFSAMATTGGTDLLGALLHLKIRHISMPKLVGIIDLVIILAGILVFDIAHGLYALVAVYITSKVSDWILGGMHSSKAAYIISRHSGEIARSILTDMDRGVTGIHAEGMYSGEETRMLYCVVSPNEVPRLKQIVLHIDPDAFVIISEANEVTGEGFSGGNPTI